ncbi:MAG: hypothetical protein AAF288_08665 [Planctomycetota bacterium]
MAERRLAFYRDVFLGEYQKVGQKNPDWTDEAVEFLDAWARYHTYRVDFTDHAIPPDTPVHRDVASLADWLLAAGCSDPLVRGLAATLARGPDARHLETVQSTLLEIEGLDQAPVYSLACRSGFVYATTHWANGRSRPNDVRRDAKSMRIAWLLEFERLLRAPELDRNHERDFANLFLNAVERADLPELQPLLDAAAAPHPERAWLAHVIRGKLHNLRGWEARGAGYANTVSEEGWRVFRQESELARRAYESAWALRQDDAQPASEMIYVSMGDGHGDEWAWFERATGADPRDVWPYDRLLFAVEPRWGGSLDEMWAVAERAQQQLDWATAMADVPLLVVKRTAGRDDGVWARRHAEKLWAAVHLAAEQRRRNPSVDSTEPSVVTIGLYLALKIEDYPAAKALMQRLDGDGARLIKPYMSNIDQRWEIGLAYAMCEPGPARAIADARRHADQGDVQDAIDALERAIDDADHPLAKQHLADRIAEFAFANDFATGDWVDLLPEGLAGWRVYRGRWAENPDGSVDATATYEDGVRMATGWEPGLRWEAELKLSGLDRWRNKSGGGFGFLLDPSPQVGYAYLKSIQVSQWQGRALVIVNRDNKDLKNGYFAHAELLQDTATIRVARWENAVRLWIDDELVLDRYDYILPPPGRGIRPIPNGRLGIGGYHWNFKDPVRIEGLRIRKLEASPFEPAE